MRAVGLFRNVHDVENVVIAEQRGVPVRIRDVAEVDVGHAPRLGILGHDDDPDVVQGTILMHYGGETPSTLRGIYDRIQYIRENHLLPPGMEIVPYYDRGKLVATTTHTVLHNLIVGIALWKRRSAASRARTRSKSWAVTSPPTRRTPRRSWTS